MFRLARVTSAVAFVTCLTGLASLATAAEDARITALVEKMQAVLDESGSVFIRQGIEIFVNGQSQGDQVQETWVRDFQHIRVEKSDGTVVTYTPEDVKLYVGPAKVLVHVPKETLEVLGDERDEALKSIDITPPRGMFELLIDGADHLTIVGEDTIIGEECWVLSADSRLMQRMRDMLAGVPDEFDMKTLQVAIGKDKGAPLGFFIELTGPAQLEIGIQVEEYEEDFEIADDMLDFQPPGDAQVLTWTPEMTGDQMRQKLQEAVAAEVGG